jgi:two-component system, OmpR family, response regulator
MRVLVVDDELEMAGLLARGLAGEGYQVDVATDGIRAMTLAGEQRYDLAVLDVMMPGMSGFELCRRLRDQVHGIGIILLTARDAVDDRVRGLDAGADDYLTKPFAFAELLARIEALLRRTSAVPEATRLKVADLELDLLARRVVRGGREIELTARELKLLEFLMRRAGQVVTRTMLLEGVWDLHFDPQSNLIDVHISRLRQAVDRGSERPLIHTIRGSGYVLRVEP